MHPIRKKIRLSEDACLIEVQAEHISRALPGQFVMVQRTELSEPVPLSILEVGEGYFTCLVKAVGRATFEIVEEAESFFYVAGPLGKPFPVEHYQKVAFYTYSWGIAPAINVARALKALGNSLILFHTSEDFYLQEQAREVFDAVFQGSEPEVFDVNLVVSAGSNRLSRRLTALYQQKPITSMVNTHMLDAVGLCLVCRVLVNGEQKLACTDGPWFDAHKVNWENLIERESTYWEQEKRALEEYRKLQRRKSLRTQE